MPSPTVRPPRWVPASLTDVMGAAVRKDIHPGRSSMSLSPLSHRAGVLSLTAAVLIVLSQVMRLGAVRLFGPDWVTTLAYTVTYSIALLGWLPYCSH